MVFIPKSYQLKTTSKSTNPIPLLNKLKLPVYQMEWHADNSNITEREQLTALFN
jgi:hypothetical protein